MTSIPQAVVAHTLSSEGADASEDGTGRGVPLVLYGHSGLDQRVHEDESPPLTESYPPVVPPQAAPDSQPLVMAPAFSKRPGQQIATRQDGASFALTVGQPPSVLRLGQTGANGGGVSSDAHALDTTAREAVFVSENQRSEVRETDFSFALAAGGGKPGQGYPAARIGASIRRLTATECERLMGWPDGFTCLCGCDPYSTEACGCPDGARYAAIGNGVAAPVALWIGDRLRDALESG